MSLFLQDDSDEEDLVIELSNLSKNDETADVIVDDQPKETAESELPENTQSEVLGDTEDKVLYPLIPIDANVETLKPNIEEIRPVDVHLSLSLPFQHLILENLLVSENALLVIGKGLSVLSIVSNLLYTLSTPTRIDGTDKRSLVLVLNASSEDEDIIEEELMELQWTCNEDDEEGQPGDRPFTVISSDSFTVDQRSKRYQQGGIISVTSRILIVDLLSGIIHPKNITGLLILHAEKLDSMSIESFIVEIYRNSNKWGFIKAITDSAESMISEFAPLAKKMKDLLLKRILLWPRFHADISSCLNTTSNTKVIEIRVSLTDSMSKIQFGLYECLKKCIDELNRKNPELSTEYWSFENALDSNFLRIINGVLSPKWHRISYESKQLVKDISTLKKLLSSLISYDALDFYELIQLILDANKPSVTRKYSESPWLLADESQLVISFAKKRVIDDGNYSLEPLPKWEQLCALMEDIEHESSKYPAGTQGSILILCSDDRTSNQLRQVIRNMKSKHNGHKNIMLDKLEIYKRRRDDMRSISKDIVEENEKYQNGGEMNVSRAFHKQEINTKRRRTRGASFVAAVDRLKNAQAGQGQDIDAMITSDSIKEERDKSLVSMETLGDEAAVKEDFDSEDELSIIEEKLQDGSIPEYAMVQNWEEVWERRKTDYKYVDNDCKIVIETFSTTSDEQILHELMPSYIIIYEPNLAFVRKLEVYKAIHRHNPPKVYFMYYGDSVEEQSHLSSIKREKEAFTKLIREHSNMAQHFETDEDLSRYKNLAHRKMQLSRMKNSRIAGGQDFLNPMTYDVVVVDMREFRAALPGLLYRYGVRVVPCMLTIGDYVITPDICIERKSIADLIGSFKNGRLDKQIRSLSRFYKYPTLLIEFDDSQSFSLEPFSERNVYASAASSTVHPISGKLMQEEIQRELSHLVMKYPSLKIVWSSSPLQTVNIFLDLKTNREQPDPVKCVQFGSTKKQTEKNKKDTESNNKFKNLLTIPGLSNVDYYNIKKRYKRYADLLNASAEDLKNIVTDPDLSERIQLSLQRQELLDSVESDDDSDPKTLNT
ncbi:Rad1 [Kluyveromyces lactis]|nr:Rad1 [Kluyveromyces lactis]